MSLKFIARLLVGPILRLSAPVRALLFLVILAVFTFCVFQMKGPNDSWTEMLAIEAIVALPIAYLLYRGEDLVADDE